MKIFFYSFAFIIMIFFSILINRFFNIPNTEWLENSPHISQITNQSIFVEFSVTQPAIIYWRVYPENTSTPHPSTMTNVFSLSNTVQYGGGVIDSDTPTYSKIITDLSPDTSYKLVALAVSKIGTFPKEVKEVFFKTKKN